MHFCNYLGGGFNIQDIREINFLIQTRRSVLTETRSLKLSNIFLFCSIILPRPVKGDVGGRGGGFPIYGLDKYVPPNRISFLMFYVVLEGPSFRPGLAQTYLDLYR